MQAPNLTMDCYNILSNILASATNAAPVSEAAAEAAAHPHGSIGALLASRWLEMETYRQLIEHLITSAIILGIAFLIGLALESLVRGVCGMARRKEASIPIKVKKVDTLQSILLSIARYTVAFIALFKVLIIWGVSAQSLTVGSAILAGAVGFGSQGLVQDMITGFTLLFEDQLQIGDYVQIGDKTGYVREVGLRITKLESLDGTEHIIFNRLITNVSNLTPPVTPPVAGA